MIIKSTNAMLASMATGGPDMAALWGEMVKTAVYLLNRSITFAISDKETLYSY
jgi:hypothetical protein